MKHQTPNASTAPKVPEYLTKNEVPLVWNYLSVTDKAVNALGAHVLRQPVPQQPQAFEAKYADQPVNTVDSDLVAVARRAVDNSLQDAA